MNTTLLKRDTDQLAALLRALQVGVDRISSERDYSDPENLVELLENRDCEILDRDAVGRAVVADPGPLYYGDIDACDNGGSWESHGAPWANRLEQKLLEAAAIRRYVDPTEAVDALKVEIKKALEGDSGDAERDALVSAAEFFGVHWTSPGC